MLRSLVLVALAVVFASPALAQNPTLFTVCVRGQADRLCGYDTSVPGGPVTEIPPPAPLNNNAFLRNGAVSVAGGKLAVVTAESNTTAEVMLYDLDGSNPELFGNLPLIGSNFVGELELSPDLSRIAYQVSNAGLYVYERATQQTHTIFERNSNRTLSGFSHGPRWSPDSQTLVFTIEEVTATGLVRPLVIAPADGSAPYTRVTTPEATGISYDGYADWSYDGSLLAFVRVK
ncbi:MAG: hypothetical protein AAF170_10560 [Bacteroidota bacterium]